MTSRFDKLYIALKFRLKGLGFYDALRALETAKDIHDGYRKDGKTPEFQHQLEIALYIFTLKDVQDLEGAIIVALLHDTDEDYPHSLKLDELMSYGEARARAIRLLNKHTHENLDSYFDALWRDELASLVKGVDRINNFQSMNRGKFTIPKQIKYADEVIRLFLPMLKKARKKFPQQMDAYYNIENMLKCQHELIMLFITEVHAKEFDEGRRIFTEE
jgi:(p)ppGpp synthase/HD superfamily hydrolase